MDRLNLQSFYPESLKITDIRETDNQIRIKMKSLKHQQECQMCAQEMSGYHGTYVRVVQDLPILGKSVTLEIVSYEYNCANPSCTQKTIVDDYNEFLSRYSRMTTRCEEFIRILALSTSCEGAAAVCEKMGLRISGDTVIRMLKKMADNNPAPRCSDTIGVDDFAYRKGQTYCTVVCDGQTHKPVSILDGRDGESLREWLKENKHVKAVTRDRAGAYAKVISEELPNAMQVADRFHLYQNLLNAVKEALKREMPNEIAIPNDANGLEIRKASQITETKDKKNRSRKRLERSGTTPL